MDDATDHGGYDYGRHLARRDVEPGVHVLGDAVVRITYAEHGQPLDWPAIFGRTGRLELEVGTSGGEFLSRRAAENPDVDYVGVEVKNRRVGAFAGRIVQQGLTNARIVHGDVGQLIGCLFWPETLSRIHVLFPDPWPKKRHRKNRFVNRWTALICSQLLHAGGELVLATDDLDYLAWMRAVMRRARDFAGPIYDASESPFGFPTRYETYWRAEERPIRYLVYARR